jgi:hypothetical protein
MKKIVAVLIPVLLLVFFILIMIGDPFLKKSFSEDDNVPAIIKEIKADVINDNWADAKVGVDELEEAWNIITSRVQFSTDRQVLDDGDLSIVRMKGFVEANDSAGTLAELGAVKRHWTHIGEY